MELKPQHKEVICAQYEELFVKYEGNIVMINYSLTELSKEASSESWVAFIEYNKPKAVLIIAPISAHMETELRQILNGISAIVEYVEIIDYRGDKFKQFVRTTPMLNIPVHSIHPYPTTDEEMWGLRWVSE